MGNNFTDDELIDAANEINRAQYDDKWYGKMNPISVTVPENGMVIISKNNGVPGPKSRAKAYEIFGKDVIFVRGGKTTNYDVNRWGKSTKGPNHAEARAFQYMETHNIPLTNARQATSLRSCKDCSDLQREYGVHNISG